MKSHLDEQIQKLYADARLGAADETRLDVDRFPSEFPYTVAEVLDREFLP
ncbi:MAG: DUF29 family protein [Cyanobacteria bacterium P01_A01_bin.17]